jgi:hypothetical protein
MSNLAQAGSAEYHAEPRYQHPLSRLTHDIKDHNNSILLGTDLLDKYWEDLTAHLAEAGLDSDPQLCESYREILSTIPMVISGIRVASRRIEETIAASTPARNA